MPTFFLHLALPGLLFTAVATADAVASDTRSYPNPPLVQPAYKNPHVLLVVMSGIRSDALEKSKIPTLDSLRKAGAYTDTCLAVFPSRNGPTWTSILTGQGPGIHGVLGDKLGDWRPAKAPSLPSLLRAGHFTGRISAITQWPDLSRLLYEADDLVNGNDDEEVESETLRLLGTVDPEFLLVHFRKPDRTGRSLGYDPWLSDYRMAISETDARLRRICDALRARPAFVAERWLVVVTSDHGGHGRTHGTKHDSDRRVFLVVSGKGVESGASLGKSFQVDIVPTLLAHLGITVSGKITLTGTPRGLMPNAPLGNPTAKAPANSSKRRSSLDYSSGASLRKAR